MGTVGIGSKHTEDVGILGDAEDVLHDYLILLGLRTFPTRVEQIVKEVGGCATLGSDNVLPGHIDRGIVGWGSIVGSILTRQLKLELEVFSGVGLHESPIIGNHDVCDTLAILECDLAGHIEVVADVWACSDTQVHCRLSLSVATVNRHRKLCLPLLKDNVGSVVEAEIGGGSCHAFRGHVGLVYRLVTGGEHKAHHTQAHYCFIEFHIFVSYLRYSGFKPPPAAWQAGSW